MTNNTVLVRNEENICYITINRPDSFNALDLEASQKLCEALAGCFNPEVRAVVIQGAGKAFCTGGDLAYMQGTDSLSGALGNILFYLNRAMVDIRLLPKPVIAAVNGAAAGGGMALAMACDLRIVSEKAKFKQAYTSSGLVPDCGWTLWAPALLGLSKTSELLFLDPLLDAQSAKELGIANIVVPVEEFSQVVETEAKKLANGATLAYAEAKALINRQVFPQLEGQLEGERQGMIRAGSTHDAQEGIKAFFDKRPPQYKGK